ncbi:MAG: alanine racemase [Candidatus Lokiarchaeota archaeon]|nr:alanine racemase [Candidatus Lokiarchaeota archaeon]
MEKNWKDKISTPALILNYDIMEKNIEFMANFAKDNNIDLRPHVKTHKCPKIAQMQLKAGAIGICVARIGEAEIFAQNGIDDILIANQVVDLNQIKRLIDLNKKCLVRVCVDSEKNILDLNRVATQNGITLEILFEVDVGLGRNGVKSGEHALELANLIKKQKGLKLVGIQGYEGHLISVKDSEMRKKLTESCMNLLIGTRDLLNDNGFHINYLTASNTVTYKFSVNCKGITEIQPGTYVFNDEHHYKIVDEFNIATTVLGTISNIPGKRFYTIDVGLKAITNDNGNPIFKNFPKSKIKIMTEEHSIFRGTPNTNFKIGQKIEINPTHICTTVNLYDFFTVIKDGEIIGRWDILARGKNY